MRKANSEMLIRKVRAERACTKAKLKAEKQMNQIKEQTEKKVVRMQKQWNLDTTVAVSNATTQIKGDLKRSMREVKGLQHNFNKSEVLHSPSP